jgi:ATP-dependent helicase HrpB
LERLGAIDGDGHITAHGRAIAAIPLEPRLAHMLIEAGERGFGGAAAEAAALLTERGLGGNDPDLELRHRRWATDRSPRAQAARRLSARWAKDSGGGGMAAHDIARAIAFAFPDRLSRRRDSTGEHWQSVGGRGFRLDSTSPLARSEWLAVAEVAGAAAGARILSAAAITAQEVEALFADEILPFSEVKFDPATAAISATKGRKLGSIKLSSSPDPRPDQAAIEAGLIDAVRRHGLSLLQWTDAALALRQRAAFAAQHDAAVPDLSDAVLIGRLEEWLAPLLVGKRRLDAIGPASLGNALQGLIGYEACRTIERLAPSQFTTPAGSAHEIDYSSSGGPTVEVRAQALYGLKDHPMVAGGRVPLTLSITSPAHRPIQTTKDLPAFWAGSWRDVAKEMRGRYPKHPWPDDPGAAAPTLKTKRASGNS